MIPISVCLFVRTCVGTCVHRTTRRLIDIREWHSEWTHDCKLDTHCYASCWPLLHHKRVLSPVQSQTECSKFHYLQIKLTGFVWNDDSESSSWYTLLTRFLNQIVKLHKFMYWRYSCPDYSNQCITNNISVLCMTFHMFDWLLVHRKWGCLQLHILIKKLRGSVYLTQLVFHFPTQSSDLKTRVLSLKV